MEYISDCNLNDFLTALTRSSNGVVINSSNGSSIEYHPVNFAFQIGYKSIKIRAVQISQDNDAI